MEKITMPTAESITKVKPGEWRAVGLALLYVGSLFLAYYLLRPIRDEMGVAGGVRNLPWLFTGTLCAMLVLSPLFALAVKRLPRTRFIALSYRFFASHLLVFVGLLQFAPESWALGIGRAFFIWVSVFNLFVISVFWSLMVDVFKAEQGKRLFGLLSAGVTAGGLLGSAITSALVGRLDRVWLMGLAVVFLEVAVWAARRLSRGSAAAIPAGDQPSADGAASEPASIAAKAAPSPAPEGEGDRALGGRVFDGMWHTFRNPYLGGIALFILFYTVLSTFLYFQQASIVAEAFTDRAARTAFFARVDLAVNALTLGLQLFVTSRLLARAGLVVTLCVLPLVSVAGFGALALSPTVAVLVVVQVLRRVANFAFARPAREILFTRTSREDRYKAKNFIDTAVYRSGDQLGSWGYSGLMALGLGLAQLPLVAVPLSLLWLLLAVWLGRQKGEDAEADSPESPSSHAPAAPLGQG